MSDFTDEHVLPKSMCGALQPTNPFKLRVCRPCNNFCGEHVDAPASDGFFGQLARSSAATVSDTGEVTPPIVPIGRVEGWSLDDTICDLWVGPAGNNVFHFHRPYPEGDVLIRGAVRARKKKGALDPGVVLVGIVPSNPQWFPLIVRSMKATFPRARVYVLNSTTAEAPSTEFDRHVAWIESLPQTPNCKPSINLHAGERLAAKMALGMGAIFLGEDFQRCEDAAALRAFMRAESVSVRGLPPFAPGRGSDADEVVAHYGWRRCHTIFLQPQPVLSLIAVLYGTHPLTVPITSDQTLWEGKFRDGGLAWAIAPSLRRFVGPTSVPEMLIDIGQATPIGPLARLEAMIKAGEPPLPPVHLAAG